MFFACLTGGHGLPAALALASHADDLPRRTLAAGLLLVAIVCAAYGPYVGRGFKQDDFGWVAGSRVRQASDVVALFGRNTGFYRPLVSVTFALDELAFGRRPLGYGLTNLALLVACMLAVAARARALGLARAAALAAGACWAFNTQGINMAVVWTSGRTALVLVLFAVLAARATVRGQVVRTALFTFLALLSKEEAVVLPVLLFVWAGILERTRRDQGYYRLTLSPRVIADNAVKYLDFAASFPAAIVVLGAALTGVVPRPSRQERDIVVLGLAWLVAGYAITLFAPIRSPLYACFPAIGTSLAAGALLAAVWARSTAPARRRLVVAGLVLPFLLLPVYWARNVRHAKGAQLSAQLLRDLEAFRAEILPDAVVVLLDDPHLKPTERLPAAFGTLYDIAIRETLGRPTRSWIEPPPDGWQLSGLQPPDPAAPNAVFALKEGHLVRVRE